MKPKQAFGAFEGVDLRAVPDHSRLARDGEHVAGVEVERHEAGARILLEVAEAVEQKISGEVGHGEEGCVVPHFRANEAGAAAAVGNIEAFGAPAFGLARAGGEKGGVASGE